MEIIKRLFIKLKTVKLNHPKRLQDALTSMLKGNKKFIMIDKQRQPMKLLSIWQANHIKMVKRVLIVRSIAGTGSKSVLAINLLVELIKRNMVTN